MSMPMRERTRSRTCPLLATTSKLGPRYLLIVFAFAGDSTMTRLFFFRVAMSNSHSTALQFCARLPTEETKLLADPASAKRRAFLEQLTHDRPITLLVASLR